MHVYIRGQRKDKKNVKKKNLFYFKKGTEHINDAKKNRNEGDFSLHGMPLFFFFSEAIMSRCVPSNKYIKVYI